MKKTKVVKKTALNKLALIADGEAKQEAALKYEANKVKTGDNVYNPRYGFATFRVIGVDNNFFSGQVEVVIDDKLERFYLNDCFKSKEDPKFLTAIIEKHLFNPNTGTLSERFDRVNERVRETNDRLGHLKGFLFSIVPLFAISIVAVIISF